MPSAVMDATFLQNLLPSDLEFQCTRCEFDDSGITVEGAVLASNAICPECGHSSERVHGHYSRRIQDLPFGKTAVTYVISARKFVCQNQSCIRSIFCERLFGLASPHARTTETLSQSHQSIGFALGGEAGARLAEQLGMPTSPDTLLRRIRGAVLEPLPAPRFVGIDDWAFKKGQSYGTILIDLERSQVIDIFPGRDGEAVKEWLKANPQVEVITRDRWAGYAQAASEGAPQAKQVADRWHLLKNLREAVERLLARFSPEIRTAGPTPTTTQASAPAENATPVSGVEAETPGAVSPPDSSPTTKVPSAREQARQAKRLERQERHRRVRELREQGHSIREIARVMGCSVKAVKRYLRDEKCPDWNTGRQPATQLDEYAEFVDQWIAQGGRNSAELFRLLKETGCRASYDAVRRYLNRKLGSSGCPGPRVRETTPPPPPKPTARKLSFAFINPQKESATSEILKTIRARVPVLNSALNLAEELASMFRQSITKPLADWLKEAEASEIGELRSFAGSLRQDEAAVQAAITEPWSNGPVEGQVNRLKVIKRTMYGRAGFALLRARVRRKS
jgi:transposase